MDWIFDNLQALLVIAIVIVAILQKLKGQKDAESDASSEADPEEMARTRRLQEEIRRKIMERRGLASGPHAPAPEEPSSVFPPAPMFEEVRPVIVEPPREQTVRRAQVPDDSGILERQRELLERLKQYQAAKRQTPTVATRATRAVTAPAAGKPNLWRAELRQPASLRRAIVLREILGPPVGMR